MTTGITFKLADMFPADDALSRWITVVCMALNDLTFVNRQLLPRLEGNESPDWENVYLGKLAASHLFEIGEFLRESQRRSKDVEPFVTRLPADARAAYSDLCQLGTRGTSAFAIALKRVRDHFFHYSELAPHAGDYEKLKQALSAHSNSTGRLIAGDTMGDFRAVFADDVAAEIGLPGDDATARVFIGELAEKVAAFLTFAREAVRQYVEDQPTKNYTIDRN